MAGALALLGCKTPPPPITAFIDNTPAPMQWYERAGRLRFQAPADWDIKEERAEQGVSVFAGRSPDNACFVLLVSVPGGDILPTEDILALTYQKLLTAPKPDTPPEVLQVNNLEGLGRDIVGVLQGEPTQASAFAVRWAGGGYLFVVGAKSSKAGAYRELLRDILGTLTGV
jgi:hypothetical protein